MVGAVVAVLEVGVERLRKPNHRKKNPRQYIVDESMNTECDVRNMQRNEKSKGRGKKRQRQRQRQK